ncbi:MAG: hypothetical protein P1Q69_08705 [Candidatus Thorarchaeota archaeon]|nr:hypothetical protein [Candidatus Thorarchaeota archaeon]
MATKTFRYFCYVCGYENEISPNIPKAPAMEKHQIECKQCKDQTHILVTSCPHCDKGVKYFLSDLDFPEEVQHLSKAYVLLIKGIKDSLAGYIEEFDVPLPERWSVQLDCSCGEKYTAEIPLPHSLE